jgi:hypothetical protein
VQVLGQRSEEPLGGLGLPMAAGDQDRADSGR